MKKLIIVTVTAFIGLTACNKQQEASLESEYQKTVAEIAYANYNDAYLTALSLREAIQSFIDTPSASSLDNAKVGWIEA
ncbi:MAG: hypothetical protein R3333_14515, partial [Lishizhenia sp.]|nr:hypothetical protein [Lishizhenia sp.]